MYALCFVDYHLRYYALFTTKNIFVIKKFIFSSIHDRKEEKNGSSRMERKMKTCFPHMKTYDSK